MKNKLILTVERDGKTEKIFVDQQNKSWYRINKGKAAPTPIVYLTMIGPELSKSLMFFGNPSAESEYAYRSYISLGNVTNIEVDNEQ